MPVTNQDHIMVIGAANADITGISTEPLSFNESNPGKMSMGAGGVGRNIAENFARLTGKGGMKTCLLSAIGGDLHGKMVVQESLNAGIDMSHCLIMAGQQTAAYFCIIDSNGEMRSAINDMSIVEHINVEYLSSKAELINAAKLIVLDANISQQAIDYICQNFNHIPIYVDTVSAVKAPKILPNMQHIQCLTPNLNEAQILSEILLRKDEDLAKVAEFFHQASVKSLFITLGSKGLYASAIIDDIIVADYLPAFEGNIINTNGAGDAFMAGLVFAHLKGMDMNQQASFAQACAFHNTQSKYSINRSLNHSIITQLVESPR